MTSSNVTVVTTDTYDSEVKNAELPVFVDFYADWCGPCKAVAPTVSEIANELKNKVKVVKINVDDSPQLAEQFGVRSIPTFVLLRKGQKQMLTINGTKKENCIGAHSKEAFLDMINSAIEA